MAYIQNLTIKITAATETIIGNIIITVATITEKSPAHKTMNAIKSNTNIEANVPISSSIYFSLVMLIFSVYAICTLKPYGSKDLFG